MMVCAVGVPLSANCHANVSFALKAAVLVVSAQEAWVVSMVQLTFPGEPAAEPLTSRVITHEPCVSVVGKLTFRLPTVPAMIAGTGLEVSKLVPATPPFIAITEVAELDGIRVQSAKIGVTIGEPPAPTVIVNDVPQFAVALTLSVTVT